MRTIYKGFRRCGPDIKIRKTGMYIRDRKKCFCGKTLKVWINKWWMQLLVPGTGRYSDNRCSDKVRIVASERNPVCGGKVSSKPKGLTRCEVLWSGGKPLPMAPTRGSGSAVAPVGSKGRSCRGQSPGRHEFYCILGSSVSSPAWSAMQNCVQCLMWKKKCLDAPTIAPLLALPPSSLPPLVAPDSPIGTGDPPLPSAPSPLPTSLSFPLSSLIIGPLQRRGLGSAVSSPAESAVSSQGELGHGAPAEIEFGAF